MRTLIAFLAILSIGSLVACGKKGGHGGGGASEVGASGPVRDIAIHNATDPSVVKDPHSSKYLLFFSRESSIWSADSDDCSVWSEQGEVVTPDMLNCQSVGEPSVVPYGSLLMMFVRGTDANGFTRLYRLIRFGLTWVGDRNPVLNEVGVSDPSVIMTVESSPNSTTGSLAIRYHLWFTRTTYSEEHEIAYAMSVDGGDSFTVRDDSVLDTVGVSGPSVALDTGFYRMAFERNGHIENVVSPNRIDWQQTEFTTYEGLSPSLLIDDDKRFLFSTAPDEAGVPSIIGITLS